MDNVLGVLEGTTFFVGGGRGWVAPGVGRIPAARLLSPYKTAFPQPFVLTPCRKYRIDTCMTKKLMSFRFEDTDVNTWSIQASIQRLTLSEWIRRQCNEHSNGSEIHKDVPRMAGNGAGAGSAGAAEPVFGNASVCAHHKGRGQLCYKCDPKFGNPVIA